MALVSPTTKRMSRPTFGAARGWIVVWLARLSDWRDQALSLARCVDPAQRQRCLQLRDPALQADRLLAHALFRRVLAGELGLPAGQVPLFRSSGGQPRLALPERFTSLSHAGDYVAVALADAPVGVDIECERAPAMRPIADMVCSPVELRRLPADGQQAQEALLATWVRKEAVLKAAGVGLSRPMNSIDAAPGAPVRIRDAQGRALRLQVHMLAAPSGIVAAVAGATGAEPRWRWLEPLAPR